MSGRIEQKDAAALVGYSQPRLLKKMTRKVNPMPKPIATEKRGRGYTRWWDEDEFMAWAEREHKLQAGRKYDSIMTETKQRTKEVWTFVGTRLDGDGKPYQMFIDADGEDKVFRKLKGSICGQQYEVTVEGSSLITGGEDRPTIQGLHPDQEQRVEWSAQHHAAEALTRKEREAKKVNDLEEICAMLRVAVRSARNRHERNALIAVIMGEITR